MTKYILAGREALQHYDVDKHDLIAKAIKDYKGDIFSIDNLDDIAELLENLRGWDDFIEIDVHDRDIIQEELDALIPKAVWINVYRTKGVVWTSITFDTKEEALKHRSLDYIKTIEIPA